MRILSKSVELRNCESEADSDRAQRSHSFQSIEGAILIPHTYERKGLMIRALPVRLRNPLSLFVSSHAPVGVREIAANRSADQYAPGDARRENIDAFAQPSLAQSRAAETFISYYTLPRRRPPPAIFRQLFTLGGGLIITVSGKEHVC